MLETARTELSRTMVCAAVLFLPCPGRWVSFDSLPSLFLPPQPGDGQRWDESWRLLQGHDGGIDSRWPSCFPPLSLFFFFFFLWITPGPRPALRHGSYVAALPESQPFPSLFFLSPWLLEPGEEIAEERPFGDRAHAPHPFPFFFPPPFSCITAP